MPVPGTSQISRAYLSLTKFLIVQQNKKAYSLIEEKIT
jgi:hypothetical protein